jgi:hypothetical protein
MDLGVIDIQGLDLVWWLEPPYPIQPIEHADSIRSTVQISQDLTYFYCRAYINIYVIQKIEFSNNHQLRKCSELDQLLLVVI